MNDAIINKIAIIHRCLERISEVYADNPENLTDYTKQDSIILNIQRACEASIDIAMHLIAQDSLGIPQTSREAFGILMVHGVISEDLYKKMASMVGFRKIAVHNYQELDPVIIQGIIGNHLTDFDGYVEAVLRYSKNTL